MEPKPRPPEGTRTVMRRTDSAPGVGRMKELIQEEAVVEEYGEELSRARTTTTRLSKLEAAAADVRGSDRRSNLINVGQCMPLFHSSGRVGSMRSISPHARRKGKGRAR